MAYTRFIWRRIDQLSGCVGNDNDSLGFEKRETFPMASSMWNFPNSLHLTISLLQILKGVDNI
jgi:hypothetical protein